MTTIFFATDVHGSDICWKKFVSAAKFYGADILILGGDMTGKAIVPIIHQGGDTYKAVLLEQESFLHGEDQVVEMEKQIKSRGYYPYRTTPDEITELNASPEKVDAIFHDEVFRTAEQWLAYADEKLAGSGIRCYVAPGNDDMFELDDLIRSARHVELAEGRVIELDAYHEMISTGWSNPTPWHTYREEDEPALRRRLEAMIAQLKNPRNSVFNFHAPPYGSTLDDVPELTEDLTPKLGGRSLVPVGSTAVRDLLKEHQPLLGLHGHIHEGKGAIRVGKTLCINPGSMYEQGRLLGAVINLARTKIKNYVLTTG
ncbi:MAG: metallophosphoesterase [Anaerolineae bacterium]|nr:metallophosphoesterase [Anaerolineae bacterium]